MSSKGQPARASQPKRGNEDEEFKSQNNNATSASTPAVKRQRISSAASALRDTAETVAFTTMDVPESTLRVYQRFLPNNLEGIGFLFGQRLSDAIQVPAERVADEYNITKEDAIEELRRLLAIKTFTNDNDGIKISPTPLSM